MVNVDNGTPQLTSSHGGEGSIICSYPEFIQWIRILAEEQHGSANSRTDTPGPVAGTGA